MRTYHAISCVLLSLALVGLANAEIVGPWEPPIISGNVVDVAGTQYQIVTTLDEFELEAGGKYKLKGGFQELITDDLGTTIGELIIEEIEFDPDPTLLYNASMTNPTNIVQSYTLQLTMPTVFLDNPNSILGSITSQVIDAGDDGATVAAPLGGSIYSAKIDGTVVRTLQDGTVITAPPLGVNAGIDSFGFEDNFVPVTTDMAIELNFTLTPGDTAAFLARFDVVPYIPEPATATLFALGILAAIRRKR